jgi:hypothetical protein
MDYSLFFHKKVKKFISELDHSQKDPANGSTSAPFARLLTKLRFASLPVTLNLTRALSLV